MVDRKEPALLVNSIEHIWSMKDILVDGDYRIATAEKPVTIIDLGSNIGVSALFFACAYANARIYAFEPNPSAFRLLKINMRQFENVKVFPWAVSDRDGKARLYVRHEDTGASLLKRSATVGSEEVIAKRLVSMVSELGISEIGLLKFDIEGSEDYICEDIQTLRPRYCIGEIHLDLTSHGLEHFRRLFSSYQYRERSLTGKRVIITAGPLD
jgi:FkbM family methyltransferase